MYFVLKCFGALLTIGAVSITGYFVIPRDPEPEYTTLVEVNPIYNHLNRHGYESGTIGKQYEAFLVSPREHSDPTTGLLKVKNSKWWRWSYRRWQYDFKYHPETLSDEFKNPYRVSTGFGMMNTALNEVCRGLYTREEDSSGSQPDKVLETKLKKNIFKYCSPIEEIPKTISEDDGFDIKDGYIKEADKNKLISPVGNSKFWDLKTKWFFRQGRSTIQNDYFKKYFDDYKKGYNDETLKTVCGALYSVEDSKKYVSEPKLPAIADLLLYCVFGSGY